MTVATIKFDLCSHHKFSLAYKSLSPEKKLFVHTMEEEVRMSQWFYVLYKFCFRGRWSSEECALNKNIVEILTGQRVAVGKPSAGKTFWNSSVGILSWMFIWIHFTRLVVFMWCTLITPIVQLRKIYIEFRRCLAAGK